MTKVRVGIIGGAGYTAGELTRLLVNHPHAEIAFSLSESSVGKSLASVHTDLFGDTDLCFVDKVDLSVDVIFICRGHGQSKAFLSKCEVPSTCKIIDLSQDFRLENPDNDFVYGLPELNSARIAAAQKVANPGCFATCIQLGLLPAFAAGAALGDVHTSGITGSTGAGQGFSLTSHFSWRTSNMGVYKALEHQHLHEIGQSLQQLMPNYGGELNFIPYRGNFTRGIIVTSYFNTKMTSKSLIESYLTYYEDAPFTHVVTENPDMKMVVNTNKCLVYPTVINGKAVVVSIIDNLLKGASGQAVENMNLMFGLNPKAGLHLKAIGF